jgi:hypothetical protein
MFSHSAQRLFPHLMLRLVFEIGLPKFDADRTVGKIYVNIDVRVSNIVDKVIVSPV